MKSTQNMTFNGKNVWTLLLTVVLSLCLVFSLCACGNDGEMNEETGDTTTTSGAATTSGKLTTTTTADKASQTTTAKTTTTTTASSTTAAMTTTTQAPTTQTPTTKAPTTTPTTVATQPTAPVDEEILGAGSKDEPYLEYPSDSMTVQTVSVPAGKSLYYGIYRVGGMILTIDSANAYVVCDGVRHDASGGSVSFTVPQALASDAVIFEIGNSGSSAAAFTLRFSNPKGSYMSPVSVSNITVTNTVSLAEGESTGYYYKYVAEKSGKLRLYMTASVDSVLLATNNRNSAQRTTESDALSDANGTYIELEVQAGDEILINVGAKPNKRGKYPATEITWNGKYA